MKKLRLLQNIAFILLISGGLIYADPQVMSVTMNPTNPGWGQPFQVTVQYCADQYNTDFLAMAVSSNNTFQVTGSGNQEFLVSSSGINTETTSPTGNIGITLSPPAYTGNCTLCTGNGNGGTGSTVTEIYNLTMINSTDLGSSGCGGGSANLYLLTGLTENYMQGTSGGATNQSWPDLSSNGCGIVTTFPAPAISPNYVSITKAADGTLAQSGDLVLFSINYSYGNGDMSITDNIPAGLTLVNYGPNPAPTGGSVTAPAIGATSGSFSWYFPTSSNVTSGIAWMLYSMTSALPTGTVITNTATGQSPGAGGGNSSTSVTSTTVENVSMSLNKTASLNGTIPSSGVTVTYTLNYSVNEGDYSLEDVRLFNDNVLGTYTNPATPPPGWKMIPDGNGSGLYGTWTISDPCNTGSAIITGSVSGAKQYPSLLIDDPTGNTDTVQFCDGIVEADVYINPGTYPGSDGLVMIRSNGQAGANQYSYSLILSIDTNPAYVVIQKVAAGALINHTSLPGSYTNALPILGNTWYKTKVVVSGNGFTFNAWVWPVGTAQPAAPLITWTDTAASTDPNWSCDGTYTDWRPGVGEQGNDQDGSTQDSYNNFKSFAAREIADAVLYDTIPAGLTYQGSAGTVAGGTGGVPQMITWSLGAISNISDSYTWWATVSNCGVFNNTAGLGGVAWCNNPIPMYSNQVSFNILCGTPTITPTLTPYISPTYTSTLTLTPTLTITMTTTITPTCTVTPTYTPTPQPFTFRKITEFPNPSTTGVNIVYNLGCTADVTAKFYTISGEYLGSVEQQNTPAGINKILFWDLKNQYGNNVSSGIYIYLIEAVAGNNKAKASGKIAVMK